MSQPETLLCDTSFTGHIAKWRLKPELYAHWDARILERIGHALLAISVVTLAEARVGYLIANWGRTRIDQDQRRLAGFVQVPLDLGEMDEWARLKYQSRKNGWQMSDNDIWIAATASTRGYPLVSCDQDHDHLADYLSIDVIYLPV